MLAASIQHSSLTHFLEISNDYAETRFFQKKGNFLNNSRGGGFIQNLGILNFFNLCTPYQIEGLFPCCKKIAHTLFAKRGYMPNWSMLEKKKICKKEHILIIINEICGSVESLFLRNYTTNFDETLHTLQGHANTGFRKFS